MKYIWIFLTVCYMGLPLQGGAGNPQKQSPFNLDAVDVFFEVADDLQAGKTVSDAEWSRLFKAGGYEIITDHFGEDLIKQCIRLAFDPRKASTRDSLLNTELSSSNQIHLLTVFVVNNYMDMKQHWSDLKQFRKTFDFNILEQRATEVLREFLIHPVDSLIQFPKLTFLCFDSNARSLNLGISIDLNVIYKATVLANARLLAHEMFHTYRSKLMNRDYIRSSPAIRALAKVQNEGLADLIDKDSPEDIVKGPFTPSELVEQYWNVYNGTPTLLAELDSLTISHLDGKITEDEFAKKTSDLFIFDGHPNGYYMALIIKRNGLTAELMKDVANPAVFARVYNQAAKMENGYLFSPRFMSYLETLEKKYY